MGASDWRPNPYLTAALRGDLPPWADRFVRGVGAAVHRFGMISDGDGVLVGVSGGKDSLSLCLALELRRRRVRDDYRLAALLVDWTDSPLGTDEREVLGAYFDALGMPFEVRPASRGGLEPECGWGCYECARARKRELFGAARELGMGTVALGHHLDDMAETLLMNLAIHARFEGMEPRRGFFGGSVTVVRPLCATREGRVRSFSERMGLPVFAGACPKSAENPRAKVKDLLVEMAKIDRLVREHLFSAYADGPPRRCPIPANPPGSERTGGAEAADGEGRHGNP